jgi:uridine kinase
VFGASDRQVLRVDHFYAAEPRGPGLFDDYDWPLLEHVLADLRHGGRLRYRGRGFDDTNLVVDEPAPEIAIVEGIQLLRRERMDLFDVTVWIECPREVALERARARDRLQGHDEEYMKLWDNLWGPRNQEYFESHHPEKLAAFRYLTHDSPVDL